MQKTSLKKNYVYNLISQILTLVIPLITTPYIARVLTEVGNGQYSYAFSIITYFILFANLGFNIYGQREVAKKRDNKEEISKVFFEILILKSILTFISLAVLFVILFTVGFGENYNLLIMVFSIQIFAVIFDIQFFYQGIEDFKSIAIRQIMIKLLGLICTFIFIKSKDDLWLYALITSVIVIFSNIIMWPKALKKIQKIKFKDLNLKRNIKPSLIIFLPTLAVTIYSVFDKTMIGLLAQNPDYENGCYEQAYKINGIALLFITVISPIFIPRNTYDYNNNNIESMQNHLYFASNYVWILSLPMIAGLCVLAPNLSSWFLGEGYNSVPALLQIMSLRFLFSGFGVVFGEQLFIAIGKEKYPTIATCISAVVNIGLNFVLIPHIGALGAAITTAISEVLVTVILAGFVMKTKLLSIKKIIFMSWKYIISASLMFVCIYFMQQNMGYSIWTFLLIFVVGMLVYIVGLLVLRDKFLLSLISKGIGIIKSKFNLKGKTNDE